MTKAQLIQKMNEIYQGDPWHGASVYHMLSGIESVNFMLAVPPGHKSIAHLMEHILAWKQFAVEKLLNNEPFDIILNSAQDWPLPAPDGDPKVYYMDKLTAVQEQLITLLNAKNEAWLDEKTSNKPYTNRFLIQGIVEHDLYHAGQIGIFNSLINIQNSSN